MQATAPGAHGCGVMKWMADGSIVVNGHCNQEEIVCNTKSHKEIHLSKALGKRIVFLCVSKFINICGASTRDRWKRKKYMGLCRLVSP